MGGIAFNTYGLSKRGETTNTGGATYSVETSFTGIGVWDYSGDYLYGDDILGGVTSFAQSISVLTVKPKGLLAQMDWESVAETAGTDYFLSAVNTRGTGSEDLIYRGLTS